MEINSHSDYVRDSFLAAKDIGGHLHNGCLVLFLGSGVSSGFGLPSWPHLVARILGKDDDKDFLESLADKKDQELALLIDPVDDGSEAYVQKVHSALYSQVDERSCRSNVAVNPASGCCCPCYRFVPRPH